LTSERISLLAHGILRPAIGVDTDDNRGLFETFYILYQGLPTLVTIKGYNIGHVRVERVVSCAFNFFYQSGEITSQLFRRGYTLLLFLGWRGNMQEPAELVVVLIKD